MEEEQKKLFKRVINIEKSLQHLRAIELYKLGVTQEDIGKHLGIAKGSVNKLLKGIKINK